MSKTLIVYYSRTGNTAAACNVLQEELGADILELRDLKNRAGKWGFFCSLWACIFNIKTKIDPEKPNFSAYNNIILGTPVWGGGLSLAMRTLIARNRFDRKKIIIFVTTNGQESEKQTEKARNLVRWAGGNPGPFFQVLARKRIDGKRFDRTLDEMLKDTVNLIPKIKKVLS